MFALWIAIAALFVSGLTGLVVVGGSPGSREAAVPIPDTPAGGQLEWVMSTLVDLPSEEDLRAHFNPEFLAAVPPIEFLEVTRQLQASGPFTVTSIEGSRDHELVVILTGRAEGFRVTIAVEPAPPHLISGLFFSTVKTSPDPVASWTALDARLRQAAPETAFLAAEVVDGECRPVHAVEPDLPLSLGSAFKLYVLGAAAEAVAGGRLAWNTPIEIRDDGRVHTSLRTESMQSGQRVPLEEMARHMIEVSDNTATDLVMGAVGREAVEAVQAEMGMTEPERNVPFVDTRELSLIKFGRPPVVDEYLALDVGGRRAFLADRLAGRPAMLDDLALTPRPVAVETVEWFASASDLCRAQVALQSRGDPVRRILGGNPGLPFGSDAEYVAFKGGSEPGVLAGSWYIEHRDGRRFAISVLLRNRESGIDSTVLSVAADAFRLASTPS